MFRFAWVLALAAALAKERLTVRGKEVPVEAIHRFLARSRSRLAMLQLEDLAGAVDQINMPGTIDEHPNWRRKLPCTLAELFADPKVVSLLAAMAAERAPKPAPKRKAEARPAAGPPVPRAIASARVGDCVASSTASPRSAHARNSA